MSKLERPVDGKKQRTYTVSGGGIFLRKGEEMGMFEMGSTVVMLFECPKDTKIAKEFGDKVKLGDNLL